MLVRIFEVSLVIGFILWLLCALLVARHSMPFEVNGSCWNNKGAETAHYIIVILMILLLIIQAILAYVILVC